MNYKELHLEAIMIPEHVNDVLGGNTIWEMEVPPFSISVMEIVYKGANTMHWSLQFSPEFDFDELNERLEEKGFDPDAYGWTDYIIRYLVSNYPKAADRINEDSEADTCVLYTFTRSDFTGLLKIVSESIRALY